MTNLIVRLIHLLKANGRRRDTPTPANPPVANHPEYKPASGDNPSLNEEHIKHLMHMLEQTNSGICTCAETFDFLDEYVELVTSNEEAAMLMPYVQRHLELCPDCHEEYEALLRILQTDLA
ncbi:MAG: hypothetical protein IPM39_00285 [Chloroflexi bacterium]|nr:hypothetical protein [Chloroflexota bacterium]